MSDDEQETTTSSSGEHLLELSQNIEPPFSAESDVLMRVDPDKLMKVWKLNTETQRLILQKADEQVRDNDITRRDNKRTRTEVRIGVLAIALAAAWIIGEQQVTRAVISKGSTMLQRVDENVKSLAKANTMVSTAVAEKHVADMDPQARGHALQAALEAQETAAEAEIAIARARHEPPPKNAVEALSEARKRKSKLQAADATPPTLDATPGARSPP